MQRLRYVFRTVLNAERFTDRLKRLHWKGRCWTSRACLQERKGGGLAGVHSWLLQAERREVASQVMIGEKDMAPKLRAHAVQVASDALDVHQASNYKDVAFYIKTEFDKEYGSGWQYITGVSFGSYVTHSSGAFIHFCLGRSL